MVTVRSRSRSRWASAARGAREQRTEMESGTRRSLVRMGVPPRAGFGRRSNMDALAVARPQRVRFRGAAMGWLRATNRAAALAAVLAAGLASCSPGYVLRGAWEEGKILGRRRPIVQVIADPRQTPETRRKLQLVLAAREFGRDALGERVGESYTLYAEKESDTLATVLSAAYRDRFAAKTWWFPIVGSVPYKGFFHEEDARREAARLEAEGYDIYMRPTSAFSTLGWFNDPVLST